MTEPYIQRLFAERIGGEGYGKDTTIYKFEKIKRAKRAAMEENPSLEMIDMGVGEPDWMADPAVVKTLAEEALKPENRWYADNGIPEFKEAAARYMAKVFGIDGIDPVTQVNHAIGSKPALAMIPSIFINPGDVTIMTTPGYPVMGTHTSYLGGEVYNLELKRENGFLPDLGSIRGDIKRRAKLLYLNYPNNPTGATATAGFFEEVVKFAKTYDIVVIQDAAYAALVYGGKKPLSFLSVPGAVDVGIELHSLSKAFNMTGWRIAFAVGNPLIISAFSDVKDNIDSGQFIAIQKAGITALDNPEITDRTVVKYERRLGKMVKILKEAGFDAKVPGGTFYLFVPAPKGIKDGEKFSTAEDASQFLIKKKHISTVPENSGGGFLRFGATFVADTEEEEERVLKVMGERLKEVQFEF
jgi:LL-diaminopimelate aminotransferase